jgi:hypothetical protein
MLALILLGAEHPGVATALRISPGDEASRLAAELEGEGAMKWAAALRKIKSEALIKEGDRPVVRSRVREEPTPRRTRTLKLALGTGVALLFLLSGLRRELELRAEWRALPAALAGDLSSVQERVSKLGVLMDQRGLWLGLPAVAAEHLRLEGEMRRLARVESQREEAARMAAISRAVDAEEARGKALLALEAGSVREARHWFAYALERGGAGWEGAAQAGRDLVLLGGELSSGGAHLGGAGAVTR